MEQFIHEAELIGSQLEQQYYEQQLEQLILSYERNKY